VNSKQAAHLTSEADEPGVNISSTAPRLHGGLHVKQRRIARLASTCPQLTANTTSRY